MMYRLYKKITDPISGNTRGTGWLPPLPDLRDYTDNHPEVIQMIKKLGIPPKVNLKNSAIETSVDLRKWCSPVEDQGGLGSCTAHAGVGIVEYYEKRAYHTHIDASRLFLYKTTRNLAGVQGDTGAWLRNVMGALVLCGLPDEKYWKYSEPDFDKEPPAFVYSVANNYKTIKYFCHDPQGMNKSFGDVLLSVKKYLEAGIPSMFGFFGFPSFDQSNETGRIPVPCQNEQAQWGHAVVAVGYDDNMKITNKLCKKDYAGALLIRNSWGTGWGEKGYGWLPYEYVEKGLASDFWSLLSMNWIESGNFGF